MSTDTNIADPTIVAQKAKTVGDENLADTVHEADVTVTKEAVAAQVTQPREKDAAKVQVHETYVATDRVITDTSDPLAVQVPDAGKSPLLTQGLPVHQLAEGTVESHFEANASEADDAPADDTPAS